MTHDQKRALTIGGLGIGAVILYMRYRSSKSPASSVTPTPSNSSATGSITPFTPQSPIVVPAGESIYDPNSEALLNTPPATAAQAAAAPITTLGTPQVTTPSAPTYTVDVAYPAPVATTSAAVKPATRLSALTSAQKKAGDIALPFGPTKPTAQAGYTAVGTGKGNWIEKPTPKAAKK